MAGTRQSFRPGGACKDAASSMVCLSWQPYNSTDKTTHTFLATVAYISCLSAGTCMMGSKTAQIASIYGPVPRTATPTIL
jgi:hypothetical protein